LRELSKLSKDATGLDQVFGVENAAAAGILLRTVDAQDKLQKQTIDTNVAQEQANIMMDTQAEKHSRMTAWFENAKIAIGEYTAAYSPYISVGADSISMMANFKNAHEGGSIALKGLKTMLGLSEKASLLSTIKTKGLSIVQGIWTGITNIATIAQTNLNLAMEANPIGVIIAAIVALIAVVAIIIKYWDDWGASLTLLLGPIGFVIAAFKSLYDHWESIKNAFQTDGIIGGLKRIGMVILDAILKPMQQMFEMIGLDSWAKKIEKFRTSNKLVTTGEADPKEKAKVKPKAKTTSNVEIDNKKGGIDLTKYGAAPTSKTDKKGDGTSTGNSGNVSKSIVQNLTINNHFPDGATKDARKLADEITGHIVDRLRDSTILIDQ
jgi:hypothetical protein